MAKTITEEKDKVSFLLYNALEQFRTLNNVDHTISFAVAQNHGLRNISIQTDDYLENPLPIHLAKLLEEYIFVK